MRKLATILFGATAAILLSASAQAQVTLRASHQFPGGKHDVRDDMVQMIAKEAGQSECRPQGAGLSGRLAVQAEPAVERDG